MIQTTGALGVYLHLREGVNLPKKRMSHKVASLFVSFQNHRVCREDSEHDLRSKPHRKLENDPHRRLLSLKPKNTL